jgi:hypothetical protein
MSTLSNHSTVYDFDGDMSRQTLEAYLSRAMTMARFLQGSGCGASTGAQEDSLRMIRHIGAKFLGRSIMHWGEESRLANSLKAGKAIALRIHDLDPHIILQAGIFEVVTTDVEKVRVPDWVFTAFNLRPEERSFRYSGMIYQDGRYVNHWAPGASVPDVTRQETQMWIFYLALAYILIGIESLHIGQIMLMGRNDPQLQTWWDLLSRIRQYAAEHARRHFVLFDAHVSSGVGCYGLPDDPALAPGGIRIGDNLLLDFHALPLRIKEIPGQPYKAELKVGHLDALYGRSLGGIAPSGWKCSSLPFLVEFDNWGSSGHGGESVGGKIGPLQGIDDRYWVWGWDEICWFAHLTEEERNAWLWYAWRWVKEHDPNGFVEMPGLRGLADPVGDANTYCANTPSPAFPGGFNQEETIKAIWSQQGDVGS